MKGTLDHRLKTKLFSSFPRTAYEILEHQENISVVLILTPYFLEAGYSKYGYILNKTFISMNAGVPGKLLDKDWKACKYLILVNCRDIS